MSLRRHVALSVTRAVAVARKDLLIAAKGQTARRQALACLVLSLPVLVLAAAHVYLPGPWRWDAVRFSALAVAALLSTASFAAAGPAAIAFASERDRDTLDSLTVSPLTTHELVLGKLLAVLASSFAGKALALPALATAYALGGVDLGFLPRYLALLLATDLSFAALALAMGARPLRLPRRGGALAKAAPSQAQLALQRSLAAPILFSLVPLYVVPLAIPLALQGGPRIAAAFDAAAPLGAFHPLLALVVWGDARLHGVAVPVWALGVAFHLLVALPLLASAAEAHRGTHGRPGRGTRALALLLVVFILAVASGASSELTGPLRALVVPLVVSLIVLSGAIRASGLPAGRKSFGRREVLLAFVDPARALESAPAGTAAYVLLLGAVSLPFVLATRDPNPALRSLGALTLSGVAIGLLSARRAAAELERDRSAFERAVSSSTTDTRPPDGEPGGEPEDNLFESSTGACAVVALFGLPLAGAGGLLLARGPIPALAPLVPAFELASVVGLAANPLAGLCPLLDPAVLGADPLGRALGVVGTTPQSLFIANVAISALASIVALATLRRAEPELSAPPAP